MFGRVWSLSLLRVVYNLLCVWWWRGRDTRWTAISCFGHIRNLRDPILGILRKPSFIPVLNNRHHPHLLWNGHIFTKTLKFGNLSMSIPDTENMNCGWCLFGDENLLIATHPVTGKMDLEFSHMDLADISTYAHRQNLPTQQTHSTIQIPSIQWSFKRMDMANTPPLVQVEKIAH